MSRKSQTWALAACSVLLIVSLASGCSGRKDDVPVDLPADARYKLATELLAQRNLRKARAELERLAVMYTAENREELEPLVRLALADVAFYESGGVSLIDARAMYLDFATLYSDHPRAPYAQLQAGVCSLRQANSPSRDQTETLRAISDLQEVIRRYPSSVYARVAREKIVEAESTLAEHEYRVGAYYLDSRAYEAATRRFKYLLERYPAYPHKEKLYYDLARALIRDDSAAEGELYLKRLISDYPDGEWAEKATKLLAEVRKPKPKPKSEPEDKTEAKAKRRDKKQENAGS